MSNLNIIGEHYPHKLGAVFSSETSARSAMEDLTREMDLEPRQLRLVKPGDVGPERKVEPETRGVRETLRRSHLLFGLLGLMVGMGIAGTLLAAGLDMVRSAPLVTFAVLGFFGASAGLIVAGALSLRPDHDVLITRAVEAANEGEWMVLVHAAEQDQADAAKAQLERSAVEVRESL